MGQRRAPRPKTRGSEFFPTSLFPQSFPRLPTSLFLPDAFFGTHILLYSND
jgi:hypothetical protein